MSILPTFFPLLSIAVCLTYSVNCFTARPTAFGVSRAVNLLSSSSCLNAVNSILAQKYFQLEESEDRETCTTEVFLKADQSVLLGESDGPLTKEATGVWSVDSGEINKFAMKLSRTFQAGHEGTEVTDMGEFTFTVERQYVGEISRVGASLAIAGTIHDRDELFGDRQVGFFNMIDTTDAKLNQGGATPFGRTQVS